MCGWCSCATISISRRNRSAPRARATTGCTTFTATSRECFRSWARYTVAIPPRPSCLTRRYRSLSASGNRVVSSSKRAAKRSAAGCAKRAGSHSHSASSCSSSVCRCWSPALSFTMRADLSSGAVSSNLSMSELRSDQLCAEREPVIADLQTTARRSRVERAPKQDPRLHPITLNCSNGDAERVGGFLFGESAKEPAFHDLREPRLELGELLHRIVELQQQIGLGVNAQLVLIERDALPNAATLEGAHLSGAVDENVPHHQRRKGEKVVTVPPFRPRGVDELEVGLVHERCRRERPTRGSCQETAVCDSAQLAVGERDCLVEGLAAGRCRVSARFHVRPDEGHAFPTGGSNIRSLGVGRQACRRRYPIRAEL